MSQSIKRSDSIAYKITQWYNSVNETHNQYLDYLSIFFTQNMKEILLPANDLLKFFGKPKSKEIIAKKEHLIERIAYQEIEIIELIEFVSRYLHLIKRINDYELNFGTVKRLIQLIHIDHSDLKSIQISYKNIVKSSNLVFNLNTKTNKKYEENFDKYVKIHSRITRKFVRDIKENSDQIRILFSQLKVEVNKIVQQQIEEEQEIDD